MAYYPSYSTQPYLAGSQAEARVPAIMARVYGWMTLGLVVTGIVALLTATSPFLLNLVFGNPLIFFGLLIVQVGLVITISAAIQRLSTGVAATLFLVYAALNGLWISGIFLYYTTASIASTFFIAGGTFGLMSIYGLTTKRDLTKIGNLAFMALIGIILASLVNFFLNSTTIYWIVTYIGIVVFIALTAANTQKIKRWNASASQSSVGRLAVLGALTLYLDLINLFLFLLRIFGRQRS